MHSSRMRTDRLLTVSQHALRRGCLPRGFLPWGVSARGDVADPPGPETDTPLWTE